jgi:hypothetical protein
MSRYRSILLRLTLGLCAFAAVAFAADHQRITGSFKFIDHFDCTDPFLVEGSYDEVMHTYDDRFGKAIRLAFTGDVRMTFTNLVNGVSYSPNTSGPGAVDLSTGESIIRGGNGVLFDSEGKLISTDGRAIQDADGNLISLTGRTVDVCARIGSSAN